MIPGIYTRSGLLNIETVCRKVFYTFEYLSSIYVAPLTPHGTVRIFHYSKQCWKSSFVRAFRSSAASSFISCTDSNRIFVLRKEHKDTECLNWRIQSVFGHGNAASGQIMIHRQRVRANVLSCCKSCLPQLRPFFELVLTVLPTISSSKFGLRFDSPETIQSSQCL